MNLRLEVFLNGNKHSELILSPDQEWLVGRGPQCQVQLDHTEVSRQHAKILFEDNIWKIRVLSRFGRVLVAQSPMEEVTLSHGSRVLIPPFELCFFEVQGSQQPQPQNIPQPEPYNPPLDEKTMVGMVSTQTVLVRVGPSGEELEVIPLSPGVYSAGRSRKSQIRLQAQEASSQHFSIEWQDPYWVIKDLESSNGTYLNGKKCESHNLQSGDEITVGSETFRFEIRSLAFAEVSDEATQPAVLKMNASLMPLERAELPLTAEMPSPTPARKKKFVRVAIGLMVIAMAYGYLEPDKKPGKMSQTSTQTSSGDPAFDKLTPEQKKLVDDTYNLAISMYQSGKYSQAGIEIEKVVQLVPNYKQSKDLQGKIQVAMETERQSEELQRQNREREQTQVKVNEILDQCEKMLREKRYGQVEECVGQINDFDPENERGQHLISEAKIAMAQKEQSAQEQAASQRRRQSALAQYEKADRLLQSKQYRQSILAFERFLDINFPGQDQYRPQATRKIREASEAMKRESSSLLREGQSALELKDYKTAMTKLRSALAVSPDNEEAKKLYDKASNEVRTIMKNLYGESVLEEASGSIESAKKKWNQIIETDDPSDPYYNKAKLKLKKYTR